jgi:serine/threonine protein kinase
VRLVRSLGEGGMGVVWLGRHELLDRDVAVKFIFHVPGEAGQNAVRTFLDGARAAATVSHPGLNAIHHADVVEGVPYLVMEYLSGGSVSALLRRAGPLPASMAARILLDVCAAAGMLHDREYVHRDIKPANILLHADGRAVLTDFGLTGPTARGGAAPTPIGVSSVPSPVPDRTVGLSMAGTVTSGSMAGTPAYLAPECFAGAVNARSDVYALGCTLYELLTGSTPFQGTLDDIRRMHEAAEVPDALLTAADVPEPLIAAIRRGMQKNPLLRPRSAQHFADGLSSALAQARLRPASVDELAAFIQRLGRADASGTASPDAATIGAAASRPNDQAGAAAGVTPASASAGQTPGAFGPGSTPPADPVSVIASQKRHARPRTMAPPTPAPLAGAELESGEAGAGGREEAASVGSPERPPAKPVGSAADDQPSRVWLWVGLATLLLVSLGVVGLVIILASR